MKLHQAFHTVNTFCCVLQRNRRANRPTSNVTTTDVSLGGGDVTMMMIVEMDQMNTDAHRETARMLKGGKGSFYISIIDPSSCLTFSYVLRILLQSVQCSQ